MLLRAVLMIALWVLYKRGVMSNSLSVVELTKSTTESVDINFETPVDVMNDFSICLRVTFSYVMAASVFNFQSLLSLDIEVLASNRFRLWLWSCGHQLKRVFDYNSFWLYSYLNGVNN